MFNYESLVNKMKSISKSESKDIVYCSNDTNNLKVILIVICAFYFLCLFCHNRGIVTIVLIIAVVFIYFFMVLKKASILLDENEEKIWIVTFKPFGLNISKIHELTQNRIRFLDVKKVLFLRKVKIAFISDEGRLVKMNLKFASNLYSPGSKNYKEISDETFRKLKVVQKIIDKGDF